MRPRLWLSLIAVAGLVLGGGLAATSRERDLPTLARNDASLHVENGVWFRDGAPFTGLLTDRDPATGEHTATPIVDGRVDGVDRAWFANGTLMYERRFVRGREEGEHRGWYADGRLHFAYHYRDGVLEGTAREWYPNGTLYRDFTYRAGHEEGAQQMWYPNGAIRANYVMRDGRRYGLPGSKGCTGTDGADTTASSRTAAIRS